MELDESDEHELTPRGLCGLTNIGNTCYMNSALQALSNCPQLTRFFLKCDDFMILSEDGKSTVAKCYRKLIVDMWNQKRPKQLTPSMLMRAIRIHNPIFRGYSQQDTQEFLRCLMDRLHEELKQPILEFPDHEQHSEDEQQDGAKLLNNKKLLGGNGSSDDSPVDMELDADEQTLPLHRHRKRTTSRMKLESQQSVKTKVKHKKEEKAKELKYHSIITSIFDGKLLSSVQCLTCNRVSNTVETFQDLSLPIPGKDDLNRMHTQAVLSCSSGVYSDTGWFFYLYDWMKSWFVGPEVQLQDCLAAFFTNDELKGDNMYNCEKCKKLRNGVKYSRVNSLPEVLCIHLKRFRHELYHSSKINTYISFQLHDLDMQPFLSKESHKFKSSTTYNLTAVITHFGSVGGGHYIAYAKNCINNKWYEFNDAYVVEVPESAVTNTEAYVLFYSLNNKDAALFRQQATQQLNNLKSNEQVRHISKEWFNRFESCVQPGPVSNYDLLCTHGAISLHSFPHIKNLVIPVSVSISQSFLQRFGGGPELDSLELCLLCKDLAQRKTYELQTFTKLHEEFQENKDNGNEYQISMEWYDSWYAFVTGKSQELPGPIDNTDLVDVDFAQKDGSFGYISEATWTFLHARYGGGPELILQKRKEPEDGDEKEEGGDST